MLKRKFILLLLSMVISASSFANTQYDSYMRQLIELSKQNPRYPFAAMIIDNKTGKILCAGVNESFKDPTYHGEMVAIHHCAAKYPKLDWSQTTLITDAEPCSMCSSAITWAKISKTVYGSSVPFLIKIHWDQINVRAQYIFDHAPGYKGVLIGNVLHAETDPLFVKAITSGK